MPLSLSDFITQVSQEIEFRFDTYSYMGQSKDWPFAQLALELLFPKIDTDQAFNLLIPAQEGNIKAGYKDDSNAVYYILDAYYKDEPLKSPNYGPGVIYNLLDLQRKLNNPESNFSEDQVILNDALKAKKDGYTVTVVLVLFGLLDDDVNIRTILHNYNLQPESFSLYDAHDIRRIYSGTDAPEGEIALKFVSDISIYPGPVEAIIGSIDAFSFKEAVSSLVPQIFDANLRIPLGRTKVNTQILETLGNASTRKLFWYYNNGITMLCRSFHIDPEDPSRLVVEAPQIVNGAQTTDALVNGKFGALDGVSFMIRVIASLPGSQQTSADFDSSFLEDLRLDIAKYTNSQNPISVPDFRSNESIHKQLYQKFKLLGWFYAHRRGQWESVLDREKEKYKISRNKYKLLSMVDLAQEWLSFSGEPALAIREKSSLFEAKGPYGKIFMHARCAEEYLIAHLLFQQIESRLTAKIKAAKETAGFASETNQRVKRTTSNYLIIGRATKRAVAHMTALLGVSLMERYGTFDQTLSSKILKITESEELIERVYPELEDTLFRIATPVQDDKYKSLHQLLSEDETFEEIYDLFQYVIQREADKGRDVLTVE